MSLPIGGRLQSYEIIALLGAGGMGEVYRARDTRLNRDVALKTLPAALVSDSDRLARFRREAQVLASLNHPNIGQVYDIGAEPAAVPDSAPVLFIVMELVTGRTLADVIAAEGAMPPAAAVAAASQIADALEAAHEQGIVHRDLKPANVMQRDDGAVKVLDFGLARAGSEQNDPLSPSGETALSPAVTGHGVILGTAAYMSPEQAKGRPVDKRADIWAFGAVLYEMLSGRRLFDGESMLETLAAVIKDTPRLDALPATTPPALRHLLARCLERDPRLRLRDIGEARIALRTALEPTDPLNQASSLSAVAPPKRRRPVVASVVAAAALASVAFAGIAAWHIRGDSEVVPVRRFVLPQGMEQNRVVISPDGTRLAYLAGGRLRVYVLRTATSVDLGEVSPGTTRLFWSPDGTGIGDVGDGTINTVPAAGGSAFTVCKVPASHRVMGAAWRADATIVFSVWHDSIYRVAATGGVPSVRLALNPVDEVDFHTIVALPGDRLIVTVHLRSTEADRVELVDGQHRTVLSTDADIEPYAFQPPNHLLFVRQYTNPGVWVAPFDGSVADFAKAVVIEPGALGFDVAADGTMVSIIPAAKRYELVWLSRTGTVSPIVAPPFESSRPKVTLSADGRRALLSERAPDGRDAFVVRDLATGRDTRIPLPDGPRGFSTNSTARWTPDGRMLLAAGNVEAQKIYDWPADGSANGRELVSGTDAVIGAGRELLFIQDVGGQSRLLHAPIGANGSLGPAVPVFTGADEPVVRTFDLSPDGHALAFAATGRGTSQLSVFVTTYPDLRQRLEVTAAGAAPRFSRDGRELFFLRGGRTAARVTQGALEVVSIGTSPLTASAPTPLLTDGEGLAAGERAIAIQAFDPAPDGRLLMARLVPPAPGEETRFMLLQNWPASIRK